MSEGFRMPAGPGESELVEKRSRFLGHLIPAESEEEAKDFIARMKRQYHDARHNCWCYRLYEGPERFSDDGEPQGSAGMPMLEVFRREEVFNFCCVVTRYFGGVLLGTGGLSRAYSGSAKQALTEAGTLWIGSFMELSFSCPYRLSEKLKSMVSAAGAVLTDVRYDTDVSMTVLAAEEAADALALQITELSGGKIRPTMRQTRQAGGQS